jgi:hypothetical protein
MIVRRTLRPLTYRGARSSICAFFLPQQSCDVSKEMLLTNGQLGKILLKFIKDNPAKAHFATVVLFMGAVEAAFPCPKK